MHKFAKGVSQIFGRFVGFIDRRLVWASKHMGLCATVVSVVGLALGFWGLALGMNWGAAQLGPLSSYLAAAATVTAVSVALRQSAQARKIADEALLAAKVRAEIDREFSHRRETTNQIVKMWTDIGDVEPMLFVYLTKVRAGGNSARSEAYGTFMAAFHRATSAVFAARAITLNRIILAELDDVDALLRKFDAVVSPPDFHAKQEVWFAEVLAEWDKVTAKRSGFTTLLRENLPLLESAEEEVKRLRSLKERPAVRDFMRHVLLGQWKGAASFPQTAVQMDLLREAAKDLKENEEK